MKVLYIGGTGTISSSCVAESVRRGQDVHVLNRRRTAGLRPLPEGVTVVEGDVRDPESMRRALGGAAYDCVVDFLSYGAEDAAGAVDLLEGRTGQYVHISSAAVYHKPVLRAPFTESTARHNPCLPYAQGKIAAEDVLRRAYDERGFPVTIVRPSHTYDDAHPPLPGGWTAWDRVARGEEIVVPGDGTSLWTLTHARDFAVGLAGLIGNWQAVGEDFHITSEEVLTWNEIYTIAGRACGTPARLLHLPSEFLPVVAPDWFWTPLILGDLQHSAVFDTTKIRRYVPEFRPVVTWSQGARGLHEWRAAHPEHTRPDPEADAMLARLVAAHHRARAALTPPAR
ncbi:nucleoside-diphosphate-sugar epimerase [Thermocatellispora tengchongensis]|uniref:Nucleoside-diphosphate-sugar epimerase n=1 Tax=Thermocatellispora tengchongensis TaxID=1073253 RepID=A0A840PMA6_9ACTN|nr:NAD-dependent epimerase/dehydratase family protein [Thermocatellispora tengchongensis]MBB5140202.1 nucleoside-diphosphate-sugar epimerase [Thermocatellispora tengchongensis]